MNVLKIEDRIKSLLFNRGFHPFSVLYIAQGLEESFIKISFYINQELDELKDLIDYKYLADPSGYEEYPDENTVILKGLILDLFLDRLENDNN